MVIEISQLKKIAEEELVGKTFPIEGTHRDVFIKSFDVYGVGDDLGEHAGSAGAKGAVPAVNSRDGMGRTAGR